MTPHDALARLVAAVEEVKSAAVLVTTSRDHLIQARNDLQAALGAGVVLIGESAHDHGNCELCDALERERDALRSSVADLTASLKMAQESLRQREAAQRAAEQERDRWHQIVKDQSEGADCLPSCNSYGHEDICPFAHPVAAVRAAQAAQRAAETRAEAAERDLAHCGEQREADVQQMLRLQERLETQTQAAYTAQEAQLAQGWTLHEAEETITELRRVLGVVQHGAECALPMAPCTCGLDAARG